MRYASLLTAMVLAVCACGGSRATVEPAPQARPTPRADAAPGPDTTSAGSCADTVATPLVVRNTPRQAGRTIVGAVIDAADARPVTDAIVLTRGRLGASDSTRVDGDGRFALAAGAGPLELTVDAAGYASRRETVLVPDRGALAITVPMDPASADGACAELLIEARPDGEAVAP